MVAIPEAALVEESLFTSLKTLPTQGRSSPEEAPRAGHPTLRQADREPHSFIIWFILTERY